MQLENSPWSPLPHPGLRVLLTGAGGGLGRALYTALTEVGATVVGLDRPGVHGEEGQRIDGVDIAEPSMVRDAVDRIADDLGGLDAVVGAAAVVDSIHRAATFSHDAFQRDVEVNLTAQFTVLQASYPHLCESGRASAVLVASQAGIDGLPGQASYAASKAGVMGLATTLAAEWAPDKIRVNAVAPGLFETPKVKGLPASTRERMTAGVAMQRVGHVAEIVGPIVFLLSPAAGYITGRTIRADGGAGMNLTGFFR